MSEAASERGAIATVVAGPAEYESLFACQIIGKFLPQDMKTGGGSGFHQEQGRRVKFSRCKPIDLAHLRC